MKEQQIVLVDVNDTEIGTQERWSVHRSGLLHRAVSVFVFKESGHLLLQRRARAKAVFGGLWANTCCTHPMPGEDVLEAGKRRLEEEMGLTSDLKMVGTFRYKAEDPNSGYTEHELDHVLMGSAESDPVLDPAEVSAFRWVEVGQLLAEVPNSKRYVPWLSPALRVIEDYAPQTGSWTG